MKALAQTIEEMVPESYQDDSFDIVVRDQRSVAVFWDLSEASKTSDKGARLSLRVQNGEETETLILNHEAGHMIVPLSENSRNYNIELGWADASNFNTIASDEVELPPLHAHHQPNLTAYRGSVFMPHSTAIERRGFRPSTDL